MAKDEESTVPPEPNWVDAELRGQLQAIEREEAPERLLVLAKELQRLLRANRG